MVVEHCRGWGKLGSIASASTLLMLIRFESRLWMRLDYVESSLPMCLQILHTKYCKQEECRGTSVLSAMSSQGTGININPVQQVNVATWLPWLVALLKVWEVPVPVPHGHPEHVLGLQSDGVCDRGGWRIDMDFRTNCC